MIHDNILSHFTEKKGSLPIVFFLCFLVIAFVPRFFSLDAHWSSDESLWLDRSAQFMSTVKQGEFSETAIAYHPGVTTMWIAGLRTLFLKPDMDIENLASARCFIGIFVFGSIGIAFFLLYRIFGKWVSLAGLLSLTFSPLFLAQTRRVHTDALATTFILLTVLLFLLYCQNQQSRCHLILSGITYGLALLSKSYALILLAWIPVCLFLFRNPHIQPALWFKRSILAFLCFLSCSLLTLIVLWPVFWTPAFAVLWMCLLGSIYTLSEALKKEPISLKRLSFFATSVLLCVVCIRILQTIWTVFDSAGKAVITPHEVKHFFLGQVINDPGWLFYPFVLTIKSTPLMLPLALLGCVQLWRTRKHSEETNQQFRLTLALMAGVVLFTICLSATSKKFSRYLLPAFPMLEILAAVGFVESLKWGYTVLVSRVGSGAPAKYKATLAVIACMGFFFIQTLPVLGLHPYYGTYYNPSWKVTDITKIITVGEASGLDIAAKSLNQKTTDRLLRVQISPLSKFFFARYFTGLTRPAGRTGGPPADYEVVYIRDSQIGLVPQTGTLNGELEAVITLNGIDHVWIYYIPQKEESP